MIALRGRDAMVVVLDVWWLMVLSGFSVLGLLIDPIFYAPCIMDMVQQVLVATLHGSSSEFNWLFVDPFDELCD
jgi:hypothetical protein